MANDHTSGSTYLGNNFQMKMSFYQYMNFHQIDINDILALKWESPYVKK